MLISSVLLLAVFVAGYLLIAFERITDFNKASIALMMGVLCWVVVQLSSSSQREIHGNLLQLSSHLSQTSQIVFFLLGAMIIVETINAHKGFEFIIYLIQVSSKRKLLWIVGLITFTLSSVLDNLTTTILMLSILNKIITDPYDRLLLGGGIVIAANAGGCWSPIGDVTTTMLWIGEKITSAHIMMKLSIPSIACLISSLSILSCLVHGKLELQEIISTEKDEPLAFSVLLIGLGGLLFVPIFKVLTGLPPFIGMMLGLSAVWFFTDFAHRFKEDRNHLRVATILSRVDISAPLFFLGILLAVDALETGGVLKTIAVFLNKYFANPLYIAIIIGGVSALVDNIPLVAASIDLYSATKFPINDPFWQLIAYCAGTGGSMLAIGSAPGVVLMTIGKIDFLTYLKKISLPAIVGYFTGIGTFILLSFV